MWIFRRSRRVCARRPRFIGKSAATSSHVSIPVFASGICAATSRTRCVIWSKRTVLWYTFLFTFTQGGMGFPTGVSVNHVAAHYTPNPGDTRRLHYGDVMKLDFGTEVNGYIIDSAFTVAFDPQFSPLLQATHDATLTGVRESGIDVRLGELGGLIEEVLNSYEVTIYGKTYPSQRGGSLRRS